MPRAQDLTYVALHDVVMHQCLGQNAVVCLLHRRMYVEVPQYSAAAVHFLFMGLVARSRWQLACKYHRW